MIRKRRLLLPVVLSLATIAGCAKPAPQYGRESTMFLPGTRRQVWAVAPAINLSGEKVDPLLQADDLYEQLQQVQGLSVIPVNRVVEVYIALQIEKVQSPEQAALVCQKLGCDGLVVPTVTIFDPWNPPKMGASLQLFLANGQSAPPPQIDPRQLARLAAPPPDQSLPAPTTPGAFAQAVGMYDAANGSVRDAVKH